MKFLPSTLTAVTALLLACGIGAAQAQTTLTMSSWVGPTHPLTRDVQIGRASCRERV